jgi:hypothetical protein
MKPLTIASCIVKSESHTSYPNGALVAKGTVNYFENPQPSCGYIPTRIKNVSVTNDGGVEFFGGEKSEYTASTLRAIAKAISELADLAEESHIKLIELNK